MTGTIETLRDTSIDPQAQRRSVVSAHARAKKRRRQLTKAQAEQAGRKAAMIMKEEPQSLTATGKKKHLQAFAIAVSKLFGKGK